MSTADKLIDSFATMVMNRGVPLRKEDNTSRLELFQQKLKKRLPQSFESLLSRYSFREFGVLGVELFGWDSDSNAYIAEAAAPKNSLSEFLLPAGFVQIGRTELGGFDALCFDWNKPVQNREYRIVQVDHEDILCNSKVRVVGELWPSFVKLAEDALPRPDPKLWWDDPIV